MSLILQAKVGGDFKPHPEGIYPAICVDVIDLGMVETEFQGEKRVVNQVRLYFETEQRGEDGKNCIISRTFTASLHPKAKLAEFLGKWRGRPVAPNEFIDLEKLKGANCTLVISHQQNLVGRTYGAIDAVSKPTKKLTASGTYDPVLQRQRIAEWQAKEVAAAEPRPRNVAAPLAHARHQAPDPVAVTTSKSAAASEAVPEPAFDPEVGF